MADKNLEHDMRSIPASMTWEILYRGRYYLTLAILASLALPALVMFALRHDGVADMQDPSILMMHIVFVHNSFLIFGVAMFASQGPISRLYAYPIRTGEMVFWRLLPAMLIIALQMIVYVVIFNTMFDLHWPISGPAITAAVAFAAVAAVVWLTEKSVAWLIVAYLCGRCRDGHLVQIAIRWSVFAAHPALARNNRWRRTYAALYRGCRVRAGRQSRGQKSPGRTTSFVGHR